MSKGQKQILVEIFNDFITTFPKKEYSSFNTEYIFSHPLWTFNKKLGIRNLLVSVGINPDCVYTSKKGFYVSSDEFLIQVLDELEEILGRENLNYNSLEKSEKIIPPPSMRTKGQFLLTDQHDFPLKKISPVSLLVGLERTFNMKWDDILLKTGRDDVKRKVSKYSVEDVYISFVESMTTLYGCSEDDLMRVPYDHLLLSEVKSHDKRLTSLLNKFSSRILDRSNQKIQKILNEESNFVLSIEILHFFWKNNTLDGIDNYILSIEDFDEKNQKTNVLKKRKNNHEQNQKDVLIGYSEGYFGHGDFFGDETLYRYINHMKTSTDQYFKKLGVDLKSLNVLKNKLNRKYNSREKVWVRIRELVKESLENNSNFLTREWLEKHDPELIRDSFVIEDIQTNSWEKVLKLYGLNPLVWNNSYPLRSYRGFVFEKSIKDVLDKYFQEVPNLDSLNSGCFVYNKLVGKGIKPDFVFPNLIIDTKFSVVHDKDGFLNQSVSDQMEKYYDFFGSKLVVLTFNQNNQTVKTRNKQYCVEIINLKSLPVFFVDTLSVSVPKKEIKYIFDTVNSVPFWKTQ